MELAGTVPIFVLGSLLHFAYDWAGGERLIALFAAVNESTWEHLKMAVWPALLWAISRAFFLPYPAAAYWSARSYGLLGMSASIIILFYGYTAILGRNALMLDISIFYSAIVFGQVIFLLSASTLSRMPILRSIGLALLAVQIAAFAAFTYWPLELGLFEDPRNGLYGMQAHIGRGTHDGF